MSFAKSNQKVKVNHNQFVNKSMKIVEFVFLQHNVDWQIIIIEFIFAI